MQQGGPSAARQTDLPQGRRDASLATLSHARGQPGQRKPSWTGDALLVLGGARMPTGRRIRGALAYAQRMEPRPLS